LIFFDLFFELFVLFENGLVLLLESNKLLFECFDEGLLRLLCDFFLIKDERWVGLLERKGSIL